MPSGLQLNQKTGHFDAKYEHPWGGVASDAAPMDIAPNQFVACNNLNIHDGKLCAYNWDDPALILNYITGTVESIALIFCIGFNLYAITIDGYIYRYVPAVGGGWEGPLCNNTNASNASCVQVINGTAYIFSFTNGTVCSYDGVATFTLGSTFVGGDFCCVVDMYLLTAYTNQPTDTPAFKSGRVNWSSPDAYTTWNPSVDRTAGFNVLSDVSDYISGIFAMGNVAYVLRGQGLTQASPTGVGIAPFNFTSLWASNYGIGCTFPDSFAQYGPIAIWANDNNIYAFTGSGLPQEITSSAQSAIYADLSQVSGNINFGPFVYGCIHSQSATAQNVNVYSTPDLEYTLAIFSAVNDPVTPTTLNVTIVFWTYKIKTKQWTRVVRKYSYSTFVSISIDFKCVYVPFPATSDIGFYYKPCAVLSVSTFNGTVYQHQFISKFQSDINLPIAAPSGAPPFSLVLRQEEIRLTRQPQVRGVAIKASGVGTLVVTVSGQVNVNNVSTPVSVTFTPIVLNTTSVVTVSSFGIFTGEDPQLSITSTAFDGVLIKATMFGTYADGEPF